MKSPIENILKAYKTVFWYIFWFSIATNMLLFALPIFSLQVFDRVISSASANTLTMLSLVVIAAFLGYGVISTTRSLALSAVNHWIDKHITPELLQASILHSCQGMRIMMGKHIHNLNNIGSFITSHAINFFFDAPWSLVFIAVIFYIHPALGIICVVGCVIIFILAYIYEVATRPLIIQSEECYGKQILVADEAVMHAETIKAMGMSKTSVANFEKEHQKYLALHKVLSFRSTLILSILKVLRYTLQVLITGVGVYLVIQHKLTVGSVIACSILSARAFSPFEGSIMAWKAFISARQSYAELQQTFAGDMLGSTHATRPVPEGSIALEHVTYISPITMKPIIEDISFTLAKGRVLGIVGPNAAGKTTLAKLIAGIIPASGGEVLLDNIDIYKATKSDFGKHIGYMPQHPQLFNTSVAQNIARMQSPEKLGEEIMHAARIVGAHDMILRMPGSYETNLGKDGAMISAGQRQLIGLARAFFGDPKVLILDEPSTGLDYHGEVSLLKAIKHAKSHGITTIIISHSKTILSYCDDALMMSQGKVRMFGPAESVLKQATANRAIHD